MRHKKILKKKKMRTDSSFFIRAHMEGYEYMSGNVYGEFSFHHRHVARIQVKVVRMCVASVRNNHKRR